MARAFVVPIIDPDQSLVNFQNKFKTFPAVVPSCHTVDVTPPIASYILTNYNKRNRALDPVRVQAWAAEMAAGRWLTGVGNPISFGADGMLYDGQNRLAACVISQTTIRVLMVFGLPLEAKIAIDSGKARSAADYLSTVMGVPPVQSKRTGPVARIMDSLLNGDHGTRNPTTAHTVQMYEMFKSEIDWVLNKVPNVRKFPPGVLAALAYAYPTEPAEIDNFASSLFATNLSPGTGPHHLHTYLTNNNNALPQGTKLALHTLNVLHGHLLDETFSTKAVKLRRTEDGLLYFTKLRQSGLRGASLDAAAQSLAL